MFSYSIILPVRNGGEYVKECVRSILQQGNWDFNLLVLDNFSTDGTAEWIESLGDERINIYRSNRSLTIEENWGRIKDIPKKEFMTMIGHDDVLLPNYLQEMDNLIARHPKAGLYQTHFNYIDGKGELVKPCLPMDEMQFVYEFLACQFARTIDSTGTGYMMRSRDFDAEGGMPVHYPNLIFSDFELWIKLMNRGYKATSLKNCFSYRVHQSASTTTNGMLYQDAFMRYMQFVKALRQDYPLIKEVIDRYGRQFLLYYCESMAHRLLKMPVAGRTLRVGEFIEKCELLAAEIIPGQQFQPLDIFRIRIARQLDQSFLGRSLFKLYKRVT